MPPKRMTANPVRPARYRAGKPVGPEESSDSDSDAESSSESESEARKPAPKPAADAAGKVIANIKSVDLNARFSEAQKAEEARLAAERKAAEAAAAKKQEEEGDSEDEYTTDESEEESDEEESEDDEATKQEELRRKLLRPTFIPKSKRGAAPTKPDPEAERKKQEEEEERQREEAAKLLEERLKRDALARAKGRKDWDDMLEGDEGVDDTDGLDPAAERAAWKLRELLRVKRERDALEAIEKEREEIERRREMDPELRKKEDMEYVAEQKRKKMEERGKMGFMQKFYHKGAFYQDDSEILKRDYATAAVEDSIKNREVLPKYLQVRGDEVGKRGRTKWTHLAAEDTSLQDGGSPWFETKKKGRFPPGPLVDDERFKPDDRRERREDDRFGKDGPRLDGRSRYEDRDRGADKRHPDRRAGDGWEREGEGPRGRKRSYTPPDARQMGEKRSKREQET